MRQQARALSEAHGLGSVGRPELLVDVFDMRLDGGTADPELGADGQQRSIRGQQIQDAALGRRQGNCRAVLSFCADVRLVGNSALTVRPGSPVRHRPKWLISPLETPCRCPSGACGACAGDKRWRLPGPEALVGTTPPKLVRRSPVLRFSRRFLRVIGRYRTDQRPASVWVVLCWAPRRGISRCG